MSNRVEISTPLRKFFKYLMASAYFTLSEAKEQLDQLPSEKLEILLGGLEPGQTADQILAEMRQDLEVLLSRNPYPVLVEDILAHHFLFHDAGRN